MTRLDLDRGRAALAGAETTEATGLVREVVGLVVRAVVPGIRHGHLVWIERDHDRWLPAEVVGFRRDEAVLLPLGDPAGIGPDGRVVPSGRPLTIRCGDALLGRVLDGTGQPMDGGPAFGPLARGAAADGSLGDDPVPGSLSADRPVPASHAVGEEPGDLEPWPVERPAPNPLARPRIRRLLATGVRAIDGLLTLGEGQRVGLFAGAGVGKSTLLGQIARSSTADVNVIGLIGERGRELVEFLDDSLGPTGLARSVVVCATSDAPPLVRLRAAHVATSIAEWFRDRRGARVLLLLDSLTRFARALREVGLSAGEPPARQGYPPSVFAALPRLLERAGAAPSGSITGIYTVLVAGGDMDEPIADEARAALDGHIVLAPELAARGHWPPIDVLASVSRAASQVVEPDHARAARRVRQHLAAYEAHRDLIALGAYQPGSRPEVDEAIRAMPRILEFLCQPVGELTPLAETVAVLSTLARR